jgi:hypothetical protein
MHSDLLNDLLAGLGLVALSVGVGLYLTSLSAALAVVGGALFIIAVLRAWRQAQGPGSR